MKRNNFNHRMAIAALLSLLTVAEGTAQNYSVVHSVGVLTDAPVLVAYNVPTIGSPAPMAAQMAWPGAWQEAQEQPAESFAPLLEPLTLEPGANFSLSMFNNEPTIAVDPNNPLHVAVAAALVIRVSTTGGASFGSQRNIIAPAGYMAYGGDSSLGYDSQGRLFWTFLLNRTAGGGFDIFIAQCNPNTGAILPGYPVNVSAAAGVAAASLNHSHDKSWLAVDSSSTSPFRDRLYVVWTDLGSNFGILTTCSTNQGATWTPALALSVSGEGFPWPSQNTVATNGDVYVSYHSQPSFSGRNPDGTSGKVFVLRSTDGGATYPQKNLAYTAGQADITFNVQSGTRKIPKTQFWLQGSVQPRILADPNTAGRIYVVANNQPNAGDFADVYIVVSTDNGGTWSAPARIDSGPPGTFHIMPSAAIDPLTGFIVVTYYDNRNGKTNSSGDFLLDVFATTSADGGVTFTPDFKINTLSFDPDLNAPCRFGPSGCGGYDTVRTLRIGEYNGAAIGGGMALAVWTGNNGGRQDTVFNRFSVACTLNCPGIVTQANDTGQCGATVNYPAPTTSGSCGIVTCSPPPGSFFPVGTNTVTCTSATGTSCTFDVIVKDTEPPVITGCPANITVEFTSTNGAVVSFEATATDNCAATVDVGCVPASGRTFAIGMTTVECGATDAASNSASCHFQVTVLGARGVKQQVLSELIALRAGVTGRTDTDRLDAAIGFLTDALDPALWLDETHLVPKQGDQVFQKEKDAVNKLRDLVQRSTVPTATPEGFVARLVKADWLLAVVSVQQARDAGLNPRKIAEDLDEIAKGDADAAAGRAENAIEHYRNAWKHAVHLQVKGGVLASGGNVRLHFMAFPDDHYVIQASTNLVDWATLETVTADSDGVIDFEDADSAGYTARFYRVVVP